MAHIYTLKDFYTYLKLGLFKRGEIDGWGYISDENTEMLRKPIDWYQKINYGRLLTNNIFLLDFYLDRKDQKNAYIIILSVTDHFQKSESKIYFLKLLTELELSAVNAFTSEVEKKVGKRKSVFKKKSRRSSFNATPLNSVSRKY